MTGSLLYEWLDQLWIGILLPAIVIVSIVLIVVYNLIKRRNAKKGLVIKVSAIIIIVISAVTVLYYLVPYKPYLPDNPVIYISSRNINHLQLEDQKDIDIVMNLLEKLEMRTDISFDRVLGSGVSRNDSAYISIFDLDVEIPPYYVGDYSIIFSEPEDSRYRVFYGNERRRVILNAEDIVDELQAFIMTLEQTPSTE